MIVSNNQAKTSYGGQQGLLRLPFDGDETLIPTEKGSLPPPTIADKPLGVHRYSSLIGRRSTEQRRQLSATMQTSGGTVEVFLYENQILWDPDRYSIAQQLGLAVQFIEYREDDPIAFNCSRVLHEIHHDKGTRALIVTSIYPWAERGRPGKSSKNEDFTIGGLPPKTTKELASLAGVSESYIEKAKEVCSFGLAHLVIEKRRKFGPVYRQFKDVCQAGLGEELRAGEKDLDTAWLQACETWSAARDSDRHRDLT